jgi:hypothetical protein
MMNHSFLMILFGITHSALAQVTPPQVAPIVPAIPPAIAPVAPVVTPVTAQVTCYNDDSLEVINRDEVQVAVFPFLPYRPQPADCWQNPSVVISRGNVKVEGRDLYDGFRRSDAAVEARISPAGFVVIRTVQGRLHLARKTGAAWSIREWFDGRGGQVAAFTLSRTGNLVAARTDGTLILNGEPQFTGERVVDFRAARNGDIAVLLQRGRIVDHNGRRLYDGAMSDPVVALKISVGGRIFYVTQSGKLGTEGRSWIHSTYSDRVVSYQVSESDDVAYVTASGRLWRNGQQLRMGTANVQSYRIWADGRVTAVDTAGRSYEFR